MNDNREVLLNIQNEIKVQTETINLKLTTDIQQENKNKEHLIRKLQQFEREYEEMEKNYGEKITNWENQKQRNNAEKVCNPENLAILFAVSECRIKTVVQHIQMHSQEGAVLSIGGENSLELTADLMNELKKIIEYFDCSQLQTIMFLKEKVKEINFLEFKSCDFLTRMYAKLSATEIDTSTWKSNFQTIRKSFIEQGFTQSESDCACVFLFKIVGYHPNCHPTKPLEQLMKYIYDQIELFSKPNSERKKGSNKKYQLINSSSQKSINKANVEYKTPGKSNFKSNSKAPEIIFKQSQKKKSRKNSNEKFDDDFDRFDCENRGIQTERNSSNNDKTEKTSRSQDKFEHKTEIGEKSVLNEKLLNQNMEKRENNECLKTECQGCCQSCHKKCTQNESALKEQILCTQLSNKIETNNDKLNVQENIVDTEILNKLISTSDMKSHDETVNNIMYSMTVDQVYQEMEKMSQNDIPVIVETDGKTFHESSNQNNEVLSSQNRSNYVQTEFSEKDLDNNCGVNQSSNSSNLQSHGKNKTKVDNSKMDKSKFEQVGSMNYVWDELMEEAINEATSKQNVEIENLKTEFSGKCSIMNQCKTEALKTNQKQTLLATQTDANTIDQVVDFSNRKQDLLKEFANDFQSEAKSKFGRENYNQSEMNESKNELCQVQNLCDSNAKKIQSKEELKIENTTEKSKCKTSQKQADSELKTIKSLADEEEEKHLPCSADVNKSASKLVNKIENKAIIQKMSSKEEIEMSKKSKNSKKMAKMAMKGFIARTSQLMTSKFSGTSQFASKTFSQNCLEDAEKMDCKMYSSTIHRVENNRHSISPTSNQNQNLSKIEESKKSTCKQIVDHRDIIKSAKQSEKSEILKTEETGMKVDFEIKKKKIKVKENEKKSAQSSLKSQTKDKKIGNKKEDTEKALSKNNSVAKSDKNTQKASVSLNKSLKKGNVAQSNRPFSSKNPSKMSLQVQKSNDLHKSAKKNNQTNSKFSDFVKKGYEEKSIDRNLSNSSVKKQTEAKPKNAIENISSKKKSVKFEKEILAESSKKNQEVIDSGRKQVQNQKISSLNTSTQNKPSTGQTDSYDYELHTNQNESIVKIEGDLSFKVNKIQPIDFDVSMYKLKITIDEQNHQTKKLLMEDCDTFNFRVLKQTTAVFGIYKGDNLITSMDFPLENFLFTDRVLVSESLEFIVDDKPLKIYFELVWTADAPENQSDIYDPPHFDN